MIISVTTAFEPEDWAWLRREAARREIGVTDVINELMSEVTTERRMTEREFAEHLTRTLAERVRRARMSVQ